MSRLKKILTVFGTRPEAIKLAPVIKELAGHGDVFENILVATGQHRELLDEVLYLFDIKPDYDLNIMGKRQTLSDITSLVMHGLEKILLKEQPDLLLVQGDSATTLAASLTAFFYRMPLVHVEAGLRSGHKFSPYPEEMNRRLISVLADIHFAPSLMAFESLKNSGISEKNIYITGNTIIDAVKMIVRHEFSMDGIIPPDNYKGKKIILLTAHRRENFGRPLKNIAEAVKQIAQKRDDVFIIIPVHKNPIVHETFYSLLESQKNVQLIDPLDYEPFLHLIKMAYLILTDSGGVQEEAPTFGKPALILRETTERPEAIIAGVAKFVGTEPQKIIQETERLLDEPALYQKMSKKVNPYGDGQASERIVKALLHYFGFTDKRPENFEPILKEKNKQE